LWGTTANLSIAQAGVPPPSQQLIRVNYKRPDTWNFFLHARIAQAAVGGPAGAVLRIFFHLILGVGRSSVEVTNFATMEWTWIAAGTPPTFALYTTATRTRLLIPGDPTSFEITRDFPAQDIQMYCTGFYENPPLVGAADTAKVAMTAYVSPKTHLRPEWYDQNEQQFRGQETGGT
jgi:hypothetical protein